MDAGEEHLFNVGLRPGRIVGSMFVLVGPLGRFSSSNPMVTILVDGLAVLGNIVVSPQAFGLSIEIGGWDEFNAVFVERQRMAEVQNAVVQVVERELSQKQPSRSHGIPARRYLVLVIDRCVG